MPESSTYGVSTGWGSLRQAKGWNSPEQKQHLTGPGGSDFNWRKQPEVGQISVGVDIWTQRHTMRFIADWIQVYNYGRPHQALGMKTPAEAYALAA